MNDSASQLGYLCDPHISAQAIATTPAWLWAPDATRILWANAMGAAIFDADSPAALAARRFEFDDPAARQIARIAAVLPRDGIPHLERLTGFGAETTRTIACGCSRLTLPDGTDGILVVAAETAGPPLALEERVQRLVADLTTPVAVFSAEGMLFHANAAAAGKLAVAATLANLGADALAIHALRAGYASGASHAGPLMLERIGNDAATFLLATFPATSRAAMMPSVAPSTLFAEADVFAPAAPDEGSDGEAADPPPAPLGKPLMPERRQPLRFVWQMAADGRFTIESGDFLRLTGARTAEVLGRPWDEIVERLGIDPDGRVAQAIASRDTWSAITIDWPVDGTDERLAVELSGLPVFDRERHFGGYRGFGVCRNTRQISQAASLRHEPSTTPPNERPVLTVVPQAENVVPFRAASNDRTPSLSPGERNAFQELAKELTSRLQQPKLTPEPPLEPEETEPPPEAETPVFEDAPEPPRVVGFIPPREMLETPPRTPAAEGPKAFHDDRGVLDRLPQGLLVYRLDTPLYANPAFLEWSGYDSIVALTVAGGLDVLFVEFDEKSVNTGDGQPLRVTSDRGPQHPTEGRLFNVQWDGDAAHALMLLPSVPALAAAEPVAPVAPEPEPRTESASSDAALAAAQAEIGELQTILDAATDGVLVLDNNGRVLTANAGAEALFGRDLARLTAGSLMDLFAPESQRTVLDCVTDVRRSESTPKKGCEVSGRARDGALLPLSMTLGRLGQGRLCAVFRDLSAWKKTEAELIGARRQAEKASSAKSEFLAKVSHEIRTPLNSIIGFSEVMMDERFGPIGNERYKQYLKDVHQSGAHLVSLLNDLLDLSKIEAGKLDLTFGSVQLNELTQQCVSLMQPQANHERVIIRTSLPTMLPQIMADARSMRQIVLNLLSNSIKFTGAGGQVIVSTTHTDQGEVVLRVRDTGHGMTEKDIQMALEPFRQVATSSRLGSGGTGLGLPLTKALAEANRANFSIKSAANAGTLVEISFPPARVLVA